MFKKDKSVDALRTEYLRLIAETMEVKTKYEQKLTELLALEKEYRKLLNDLLKDR